MSISMMYLLCFIILCVRSTAFAANVERQAGCDYEDRWVESGTVVWEDPECECTQLVCLGYQVELVKKAKPCCKYQGAIYGTGETITTGLCQETVCKEGKEVSLPRCPKDFVPITYNDCIGCYNVSVEQMNHLDSKQYCQGLGGKLVEITTEGEEKALEWHLFENYYKKGVTSYWTGGYFDVTDSLPFFWPSLTGIPIKAIYDDFCHKQPTSNPEHTALQLSYYDYGHYCWCNESPMKMKLAICEICTQEKPYQTNCIYKDKIYAHGDLIADIVEVPGPCFELVCNNGKTTKKEKPCDQQVWEGPNGPLPPPPPPFPSV